MSKRTNWYGPAYFIEGVIFGMGCYTKSFLLTAGGLTSFVATAIKDSKDRRADVKAAYKEGKRTVVC